MLAVRVAVAAWLLLASFVCVDAADARAHLPGAHEAVEHAAGHDGTDGPALATAESHAECGADPASVAVGVAPVKLTPAPAGSTGVAGADLIAATGIVPVVARPAGSPPSASPGSPPLRI
jgi:hypothetical protein